MGKLDVAGIFQSEALALLDARARCRQIHGTVDIRAAGNEVEEAVRSFFRRMLPAKYYVAHGHIVDADGNASPQLDIIVADAQTIPSLMKTRDGTEYFPFEAVYAVGEVKSTYYKSSRYIESFSNTIRTIRQTLSRKDIVNTAYDGIRDDTVMRDLILHRSNRVLNYLFAFAVFVDCGDFESTDVTPLYQSRAARDLPNLCVLLNKGILLRGRQDGASLMLNRYPEFDAHKDEAWFFSALPESDTSSLIGSPLGILYFSLLEHLNGSFLEPPQLSGYLAEMLISRRSLLERLPRV